MKLSTEDLNHLCSVAIRAGRAAGTYIAEQVGKQIKVESKRTQSPASQVVTEVDFQSQAMILEALLPTCDAYDLALLAEESADCGQRQSKDYFWCIDPLDGTLPFIENSPGYSVSIGLIANDGTPQIGVIYDPVNHTLYHAIRGQGAFRNGEPWKIHRDTGRPLLFTMDRSFVRHPQYPDILAGIEEIAKELGCPGVKTIRYGGGAMNTCWALEQAPGCYFKFIREGDAGGSLWDYAASACIYDEIGAVASDIFGDPMDLNRAGSTYMNHRGILYADSADLAKRIVELHKRLNP